MTTLAEKFTLLKTSVGGNREKSGFEYTFGMPEEEVHRITPPSRMNRRILAELEYALHVSEANGDAFSKEIEEALNFLLCALDSDGVLTDAACRRAEEILSPMAELAKSYTLYLTGHAHIDMNWMWSYQETVAATLATFRTMCDIMDEYPEFTFTQSQGSVYRITEQYDPELMARIQKHIASGRWEVAATNWVEPDKNMPSGESLLRHIEYTRRYLRDIWGVKNFDIDFVPDTFGHAETIPEIDAFGGVKYMYHCRGNARKDLLYRYRAPSGREILVLREANWYNAAITPQIASGLMEAVRRSSGLKVGMVVYGVGDHGGGPTRRDVERAIDMMTWPVYPTIRFGGLRDYFREAEVIRDALPVVTEEMNFFAPGCYTTQSRIKRGNRRAEAALYDAEALSALAQQKTGFSMAKKQVVEAWRDVLFTHFHDILTGSCVQDSREHAMGLFQGVAAVTNTQLEKAMASLAKSINTAHMPVLQSVKPWETAEAAKFDTQSEGAGVGYGIEHFTGVPAAERGSGMIRVFHVFNTLSETRTDTVELTVWDYRGDLARVYMQDADGNEIPFCLLDNTLQKYWDHRYFRVLARVTVPAVGYTTVVLRQREAKNYPAYLQDREQVARFYDDAILDNGIVRAVLCANTGRVKSLVDRKSGAELLKGGETAGLQFLETERRTSSAWNIGRTLREIPVDKCMELVNLSVGEVRQAVKATYLVEGGCRVPSKIEATYSLDTGSRALRVSLKADWQEQGSETIPVLTWKTPASNLSGSFRYLIPSGSKLRKALNNDVPGIGGGMALRNDGIALALISDSKYGYRGEGDALSLTLINSSVNPDPYPERGIHNIVLWLAASDGAAQDLQRLTDALNHPFFYQPSNVHEGTLPRSFGLIGEVRGSVAVTSVQPSENGILVRGYEASGMDGEARIAINMPIQSASLVDLSERGAVGEARIEGNAVVFAVKKSGIWSVSIRL
ncbi:MAG: glycoside hydrolase family 38 C-terminal domain-containing protein [Christensenellales bacterium]|jgi:alpha-mannosidase